MFGSGSCSNKKNTNTRLTDRGKENSAAGSDKGRGVGKTGDAQYVKVGKR